LTTHRDSQSPILRDPLAASSCRRWKNWMATKSFDKKKIYSTT